MKINRVEINNFRSIKDKTLTFDSNFQTLVGINESGKSNILKEVSLLDKKIPFSIDDIRDPGYDEPEVKRDYVRFISTFDQQAIEYLIEKIREEKFAINTHYCPKTGFSKKNIVGILLVRHG